MKKFLITALVLLAGISAATAGIGIAWDSGGWLVAYGEDPTWDSETEQFLGKGVAGDQSAIWQLIYAGANGAIDAIDLDNAANGYVSEDDVVWADRTIPAGGGKASDGTEWNAWLELQDGSVVYKSDITTPGSVYQRIFQGTPAEGSYYYETGLYEYDPTFAGGTAPIKDFFNFDESGNGLAVNQQIPVSPTPPTPTIPEPATMSLLGLGAMAMVLRRKLRK